MIRSILKSLTSACSLLILCQLAAQAQITTGTPPFGSYSGGPDIVNNANLNAHLSIPVLTKAGRGLPFSLQISYDSSVWYPSYSGGTTIWTHNDNAGWQLRSAGLLGYVSYTQGQTRCSYVDPGPPPVWDYINNYSNWVYHEPNGTTHAFAITVYDYDSSCPKTTTATVGVNDGSGLTLSVDNSTGNLTTTLYTRSGATLSPPLSTSYSSGTLTDANGNQLSATYNGSTWSFYETLSSTAAVTLSGSGNPSSPLVYTYTPPGGGSATVHVNYSNYTVRTNFNCSGVAEYGPYTVSRISSITLADGTSYSFTYEPTPGYSGDVTDRIKSISLPTGGTITYTYTGGNNGIECADGSTSGLTRVVTATSVPTGTWTYTRSQVSGAQWTTTLADAAGISTTMNFQGLYETSRNIAAGANVINTCYNNGLTSCDSTAVSMPITRVTVTNTLGGMTSQTDTQYTTLGLPFQEDVYNFGTAPNPGARLRRTEIVYASLANYIADHPSSITVCEVGGNDSDCNSSGTKKSQTTFSYGNTVTTTSGTPQHVAVSGDRGNAISVSKWIKTTNSFLSTTASYYDTGLVNVATDPNTTLTATYTYGYCGNAFPSTIQVQGGGVSLQTSSVWDCNAARATSTTDPNSKTTSYTYDSSLRRLTTSFPDGGCFQTQYTSATLNDFYTCLTGGSQRHDGTALDGVGRPIEQYSYSDPSGTDTVDITYDAAGRLSSRSNPYRSGQGNGADSYTYGDALGRLTRITHADTTHSDVSYSSNCATSTDESLRSRQICTDALGRVNGVTEDPGGSLQATTSYTYDSLDDLLTVSQGTQSRTYTYDSVGRVLTATTPELGNPPGTIHYTYDTADSSCSSYSSKGDLVEREDARGVYTCYQYDSLHRLTQKSYTDTPRTATVTYGYDAAACLGQSACYNKGRRTSMTDAAGSEAWAYDSMGRPIADQRTTNGYTKTTTYAYNLDGSLSKLTYGGSGRIINYTTNALGQPTQAQQDSSQGGYMYAQTGTYSAFGALGGVVEGYTGTFGGITAAYGYDNRLRLSSLSATSTSGTAANLQFSYFANSNVQTVTNNRDTGRTESLTYDSLNRVITASSNANSGVDCWGQAVPPWSGDTGSNGYDRFGNLSKIDSTKCSTPPLNLSIDQTTNRINSANFSHDAAGNLLTDGVCSYTWDAEGRLTTSSGSVCGGSVTYTYDGDGRRVKKSTGTLYWYGAGGSVLTETDLTGGLIQDYLYFAGGRMARIYNHSAYFYFGDQIGSSRVITYSNGTICYDADFYMFGGEKTFTNACPQPYKFAGMERDTETQNDHTMFRYYASNYGRWLSPDPLGGDISNPQSLN